APATTVIYPLSLTRRSSDLVHALRGIGGAGGDEISHGASLGDALLQNLAVLGLVVVEQRLFIHRLVKLAFVSIDANLLEKRIQRSEEHTSELQSRENLVCRL